MPASLSAASAAASGILRAPSPGMVVAPTRAASRMPAGRRGASARAAKAEAAKANGAALGFVNNGRFLVEEGAQKEFEAAWEERETGMKGAQGFAGFDFAKTDESDPRGAIYEVCSKWDSIPEFEEYSLSLVARRSHLPPGVWQFVQPLGAGFPEDFVPLLDTKEFPSAKYPPKPKKAKKAE